MFPPFKMGGGGGGGGCEMFYPVLKRWGHKKFGLTIHPFCSPPPLHVINYQSLRPPLSKKNRFLWAGWAKKRPVGRPDFSPPPEFIFID